MVVTEDYRGFTIRLNAINKWFEVQRVGDNDTANIKQFREYAEAETFVDGAADREAKASKKKLDLAFITPKGEKFRAVGINSATCKLTKSPRDIHVDYDTYVLSDGVEAALGEIGRLRSEIKKIASELRPAQADGFFGYNDTFNTPEEAEAKYAAIKKKADKIVFKSPDGQKG